MARDPFPINLYSWLLPDDMQGHVRELIKKDTLPDPSILITGLYVGLALTVLRIALNVLVFRPLARKVLVLDRKPPSQQVAPLDAIYHPKKKPAAAALAKACDACGFTPDQALSYLKAKRAAASQSTLVYRFTEAAWRAVLYSGMVAFGLHCLVGQSWFRDPWTHCWKGWPHQKQPDAAYQYYALGMGVYTHFLMFQAVDTKRSDFVEMVVHHVATMSLIVLSWVTNFVRAGSLVMLLHDLSDVPLETAKVVNYIKASRKHKWWAAPAADIIFGLFAVTFLVTRLGAFPYYILYNTTFVAPAVVNYNHDGTSPSPPCYWIFNALLLVLQALHIFWAVLILRMVYRVLVLKYLEDIRSDDEGEWDDSKPPQIKAIVNGEVNKKAL